MTHRYNVLAISGNNGGTEVALYTPASAGDTVITGGEWKAWNSGNPSTGYTLKSNDVYRCVERAVDVPIYNSMTSDGVAGNMTVPIPVYTGFYDFAINIQYKASIKNNPSSYDGENMRSTIVFFLGKIFSVTYINTNGPEIAAEKAYYDAAFTSAAMVHSPHYIQAASVTVTMGGNPFDTFTYDDETGIVVIPASQIKGDLVITAVHSPEEYNVTYTITDGSADGPAKAGYHVAFTATITPSLHYVLPASITVTMGGESFKDFTYDKETGKVDIAAGKVEGALVITAVNVHERSPNQNRETLPAGASPRRALSIPYGKQRLIF